VISLPALALMAAEAGRPARETPAAREQARQCLALPRAAGAEACRRALLLGLLPARAAVVRRALAARLIALDRTEEALDVYRDAARAQPDDADAHLRLGEALLAHAGDAPAALSALDRAGELRPDEPRIHGARGLALGALGRAAEAVAAFETAERLDPDYFQSRPAARRVYEAARRGERWP
jgi:tetratricopeptide (TPR) repeat protein